MKYTCLICGYTYDEEKGIPQKGIDPKTVWQSVPESFTCPLCGMPKRKFRNLSKDFGKK